MPSRSAWAQLITSGSTWPTPDAALSANPKTGTGTCGSPGNLGIPANGGTRPGRGASSSFPSTPPRPPPRNCPSHSGSRPRTPPPLATAPAPPPRGEGLGKNVAPGPGAWGVAEPPPPGRPADLLDRPANAVGVARELDGAGVGQVLALPRHRRHDQPTEERSHQAQHKH